MREKAAGSARNRKQSYKSAFVLQEAHRTPRNALSEPQEVAQKFALPASVGRFQVQECVHYMNSQEVSAAWNVPLLIRVLLFPRSPQYDTDTPLKCHILHPIHVEVPSLSLLP